MGALTRNGLNSSLKKKRQKGKLIANKQIELCQFLEQIKKIFGNEQWPSGQGAKLPGYWVKKTMWLLMSAQPFIFPRLMKWAPETHGDLKVKSKLFSLSGCVALR